MVVIGRAAAPGVAAGAGRLPTTAVPTACGPSEPVMSVQALVQASKSVHFTSVRPSRQAVVGVFQYQTSSK